MWREIVGRGGRRVSMLVTREARRLVPALHEVLGDVADRRPFELDEEIVVPARHREPASRARRP